ncbi:MAG: hypothetical protein KBD22_02485, partial [Candidatus Pacebacteria bacterium]|nr:hypothetical protein [Candidatus Paceibacterota bacterium]
MKISIFLALLINTAAVAFFLTVLSFFIEKVFVLEMDNFMFVLLLSFMLLCFQVAWIKNEQKSWIK